MNLEKLGATLLLTVSSVLPGGHSTSPQYQLGEARATAAVTNHNPLDVDIFILAGGTRFRLGTVVTSQTQEFDLPTQAVNAGPVRVAADPIGARTPYTSDPLTISDGDRIRLTVSPQLTQSTVSVERTSGQ